MDEEYNFDEEYGYLQQQHEQENQFQLEFKAFERMGREEDKTVADIAAEAGVIFQPHQKGKIIRDPIQKFYVYVNASALKLINEGYIPFVQKSDVRTILEKIRFIKNIQYKNPDAFVLGYAVVKSGSLNLRHFDLVCAKISELDPPLKRTDVLRYARLWSNL